LRDYIGANNLNELADSDWFLPLFDKKIEKKLNSPVQRKPKKRKVK
jgi:hypothetical protein